MMHDSKAVKSDSKISFVCLNHKMSDIIKPFPESILLFLPSKISKFVAKILFDSRTLHEKVTCSFLSLYRVDPSKSFLVASTLIGSDLQGLRLIKD